MVSLDRCTNRHRELAAENQQQRSAEFILHSLCADGLLPDTGHCAQPQVKKGLSVEAHHMQPEIVTERLLLRPLKAADVAQLVALAGNKKVADTTATIPHPYHEEDALFIIQAAKEGHRSGVFHAFAICYASTFLGVVSLKRSSEVPCSAELGYWIGVPFWGNGFATEAAQSMLDYAFNDLGLQCVRAKLLCRNTASGRVLRKLGMKCAGVNAKAIQKWDIWEDEEVWSMSSDARAAKDLGQDKISPLGPGNHSHK